MSTNILDRYQKLKKQADELVRQKAQAEGRLSQCLQQLEGEFGCKTIEQGEKQLAKLKRRIGTLEEQFEQEVEEFERKWDNDISNPQMGI